jgi:hypothetical protein
MSQQTTRSNAFATSDTAVTPKSKIAASETSQVLASANPARVTLTISNDSGVVAYLAKGPTAVIGEGIRLNPEGGSIVIDDYLGQVTVIAKAAEANVCFCEV